jgi:hypothetical protein
LSLLPVKEGCFEARKGKVERRRVEHGAGEIDRFGIPLEGRFLDGRAPRIREAEESGRFVERFASRVIQGLADRFILTRFVCQVKARVASAGDQGEVGVFDPMLEVSGIGVSFDMIDRKEWKAPGPGQRFGRGEANQNRPCQTRTVTHGDGVECSKIRVGFSKCVVDATGDDFSVSPTCDFGNHTTESGVEIDLGGAPLSEHLVTAPNDSGRGFVTGRLDSQYDSILGQRVFSGGNVLGREIGD